MDYLSREALLHFIDLALAEDLGDGDHSTLASIGAEAERQAQAVLKDRTCVVAGVELARLIFHRLDPSLDFRAMTKDGEWVEPDKVLFTVSGKARPILSAERLALNCLQRMSGIATLTRQLIQELEGTRARLLDTRKTTPNFRLCEKWAVKIGGGENHRFGLFDMMMLKDNHIDFAGGVALAMQRAKAYREAHKKNLKLVVEVRNLEEVRQALDEGGAQRLLLDNMDATALHQAVDYIAGRVPTEASGGIGPHNLREVALSGVDFISMGALTHSARSVDISLKAIQS
ncbi:MAG: carboxylating nicotinate-nucleotide diphosphorylase [Cytophagales bacterium]|nr:carboxylating nicotinate-nucleotide diphosphorylase [Cytophagales bacterium]